MAEQGTRLDAGKSALELIPWSEIHITDFRTPVRLMAAALQTWWCAAPTKLESSIPQVELLGIGDVLGFGARKYAPRNWEKGLPFSRIIAPALRHALRLDLGERLDPESRLPHESHFWCNVLFLVVFTRRGRTDLDDRPAADASVLERINANRTQDAGLDFAATFGATQGVS